MIQNGLISITKTTVEEIFSLQALTEVISSALFTQTPIFDMFGLVHCVFVQIVSLYKCPFLVSVLVVQCKHNSECIFSVCDPTK